MPRTLKRIYNYKLTINDEYWANQLRSIGKRLTKKEKKLLRSVKYEKQDNEAMARIQAKAITNGLYIPRLTELVGDCMFESIEHSGFCADREEFRKSIAILFFLFGDCKVISAYEEPLKEVFAFFNEIEHVYCHDTNLLFKYTYYTMCSDMFTSGSWSRLPTELVMTVISVFFKVRFHIYHDNGHIDKICDIEVDKEISLEDRESNIYLALIGENHYVPLVHIPDGMNVTETLKCPKYDVQLKKFHRWAREKADTLGLYDDVIQNVDPDDDSGFDQESESRSKGSAKKSTNGSSSKIDIKSFGPKSTVTEGESKSTSSDKQIVIKTRGKKDSSDETTEGRSSEKSPVKSVKPTPKSVAKFEPEVTQVKEDEEHDVHVIGKKTKTVSDEPASQIRKKLTHVQGYDNNTAFYDNLRIDPFPPRKKQVDPDPVERIPVSLRPALITQAQEKDDKPTVPGVKSSTKKNVVDAKSSIPKQDTKPNPVLPTVQVAHSNLVFFS